MINPAEFNKRLLASGVSQAEFARKSGKTKAAIVKYGRKGVPDKEEKAIGHLLDNAAKPIFFGEQTSLKDI